MKALSGAQCSNGTRFEQLAILTEWATVRLSLLKLIYPVAPRTARMSPLPNCNKSFIQTILFLCSGIGWVHTDVVKVSIFVVDSSSWWWWWWWWRALHLFPIWSGGEWTIGLLGLGYAPFRNVNRNSQLATCISCCHQIRRLELAAWTASDNEPAVCSHRSGSSSSGNGIFSILIDSLKLLLLTDTFLSFNSLIKKYCCDCESNASTHDDDIVIAYRIVEIINIEHFNISTFQHCQSKWMERAKNLISIAFFQWRETRERTRHLFNNNNKLSSIRWPVASIHFIAPDYHLIFLQTAPHFSIYHLALYWPRSAVRLPPPCLALPSSFNDEKTKRRRQKKENKML